MDNLLVKQGLTTQQLALVSGEYEDKKKNSTLMYVIWFFLGGIGGHRYYLGDVGIGIAMTLTLGGLGLWALVDVFFIGGRLRTKNQRLEQEIIARVKSTTIIDQPTQALA